MKAQKKPRFPKKTLFLHKTDGGKPPMRLVHWRKTMLFRLFVFGDEATNFWVSLTKFQLPNNFPHHPFFSRYLLPEKGRKTILPILYICVCPVKTKKGTPCSLTLTGVPKKKKICFLLVWSAKFGGYDIEYPFFGRRTSLK